jgi:hypothetical protein
MSCFGSLNDDYMYEAISAMDDDEIVSVGRPYGGMAIL